MASVQRFSAKVIAVRQLTHDVRQIDFRLMEPREIRFKAGQFVSFEVPDARTGRTVTRPYSIASAPSTPDRVSLLLNFVPDGPGSTYLFKLNEGDTTTFSGPAGNFYLRDDPERELLFVATGTGIAPIRSMLLANADRPQPSRTVLFWGLRRVHMRDPSFVNLQAFKPMVQDLYIADLIATLAMLDPILGGIDR